MAQTQDETIKSNGNKLWTNQYIMVVAFNLLMCTAHYMLISTLPVYAKHIGGDNSAAGLLMGAFTIAALLFRPVFGTILDTSGRKAVFLTGSILFLAGTSLTGLVLTIPLLLLLRFVQGIGFSANSTAGGAAVADLVPASRLSEGIGYFGISVTVATAAGPAVGIYLIDASGYNTLFFGAALLMLAALLLVVFLNYEAAAEPAADMPSTAKKRERPAGLNICGIFEKDALPSAFLVFFTALAFGSILTFMPIYAAERGFGNVGLFYMIYAGAILTTRLFTGKLADRIGIAPVILPAMALMVLSFAILAFARTLSAFLAAAALFGFSYGTVQPLLNTLVLKSCPAVKRGAASAIFFSAMDIGIAVGSMLWGIISQVLGFTGVYLACAACALISGAAYLKNYTARN